MDFTIKQYTQLLKALQSQGYLFQTFAEFLQLPALQTIVLRHDVDLLPNNSLQFAKIQAELNIKGSYFFRAVPESWDEKIIKEIASLGHEIGYHYEDIDLASSILKTQSSKFKEEDLYNVAIDIFQENLNKLRKLYPVKTICMHGSPLSKYDNKDLWRRSEKEMRSERVRDEQVRDEQVRDEQAGSQLTTQDSSLKRYHYHDFGIIGEPYFDIDFDKVFYLTDTGRRWDGWKTSVRDKISQQEEWVKQGLVFHSTQELITAINTGRALSGAEMPNKIMMTFHPQRWHDRWVPWVKELVWQNVKNVGKRVVVKLREGKTK